MGSPSEDGRTDSGSLARRRLGHLITKILLGVFGSVPAFDTYFKKGFGASTYGHRALGRVETFYRENKEVVEGHRVATLDFQSGEPSRFVYSRAKVIDMIFFVEGGA